MELEEHHAYTGELLELARAMPEVLGIVALGSMAERDYAPDRWSDHDFFVVTRAGDAEALRRRVDWLPRASDVAYWFRETTHGLKVIYGRSQRLHLVELAVFEPEELRLARVNRYRVLLDRSDVSARMEAVAHATHAEAPSPDRWLLGQLLSDLWVAGGRHRRGETLSARQRLHAALAHLLRLLSRHQPSSQAEILDDLDPHRRFERAHPALSADIMAALTLPTDAAAVRLLEISKRALASKMTDFPIDLVAVIQRELE